MKTFFFCTLFLVIGACVDPYQLHLGLQDEVLIVDGMITDGDGPYLIKLYHDKPLTEFGTNVYWVSGATMTITDSSGIQDNLIEKSPGNYYTTSMKSVMGNSYTLKITTAEGELYESIPEKLVPVGEIEDLKLTFEVHDDTSQHSVLTASGFNVSLDTDVYPEQQGRVRWRWNTTFELHTHPERTTGLFEISFDPPTFIDRIYPASCSGWIRNDDNRQVNTPLFQQIAECTCCTCWVSDYSTIALLSEINPISTRINDAHILFVPGYQRYFVNKYHIEIEQLSVSEKVFAFWQGIHESQELGTDLFQAVPRRTKGNMNLISEKGRRIIGIFSVSAVRKKTIDIYSKDVPLKYHFPDTINEICSGVYRFKTSTTKPSFY